MSWWSNRRRVLHAAGDHGEVFLLGEEHRQTFALPEAIASADEIMKAAERRAREIIATAEAEAARVIAGAQESADSVRELARAEGYEAGRADAIGEFRRFVDLARAAARDGKAVRDGVVAQAGDIVARAATLAARRLVAEYYEADPERTAAICAEAVRSASSQEVLRIRVAPGVAAAVEAALGDMAGYVVADGAVAIGGCLVELRDGLIDATLDARLDLAERALREAASEEIP
ncbi:MAG: hypothetical protein Kow0010_09070 [Dehalococcoidia bacterium]